MNKNEAPLHWNPGSAPTRLRTPTSASNMDLESHTSGAEDWSSSYWTDGWSVASLGSSESPLPRHDRGLPRHGCGYQTYVMDIIPSGPPEDSALESRCYVPNGEAMLEPATSASYICRWMYDKSPGPKHFSAACPNVFQVTSAYHIDQSIALSHLGTSWSTKKGRYYRCGRASLT